MFYQPSDRQKEFMRQLESGDIKFVEWDSVSAITYLLAGRRGGKRDLADRLTGTIQMKLENGVWVKL